MKKYIFTLIGLLFINLSLFAQQDLRTFTGKIDRISDGDTIKFTVTDGPNTGTSMTIRLAGIDAPEIAHKKNETGQPLGQESKAYLSNLCNSTSANIQVVSKDQYGRIVALIWIGQSCVNVSMVRAGMAEAYREYLKDLPKGIKDAILTAEINAKEEKLGIWSLETYTRPSIYRRNKK